MQLWKRERGTLWALDAEQPLPPLCSARVQAEFAEVRPEQLDELAGAMGLPDPQVIRQRLQSGRRSYTLRVAGQIAAYGWVTRGVECVGELEREFHLRDDEAYIWDCGTVAAWRGQRFYSALLSQLIRELFREDTRRIWIGASRHNQASISGIANAGFKHVLALTFWRAWRLAVMWFSQVASAPSPPVAEAYRILLGAHERRFGRLALGYKR
jgi:ribosomal protein S18 acetylase RimI-like enzyme